MFATESTKLFGLGVAYWFKLVRWPLKLMLWFCIALVELKAFYGMGWPSL